MKPHFKKRLKGAALTALVLLALPLSAFADIVVLHTNDTHAAIDKHLGFAKVAQYKKDTAKDHDAVVLVDAGDAIQGEPAGRLSLGSAIIRVMNAVGYDFAIPGNHEFDYGVPRFLELAPQLSCGYYSTNIVNTKTGQNLLPAYKMMKLDGKQVAFLGVTTPETLVSANPSYFKNEAGEWIYGFSEDETGEKLYAAIQQNVDKARKEGADIVILVGHLGDNGAIPVWSSPAVIAHTSGIDAVIDGHSHEQYSRVLTNKEGKPVVLAQTGTKLETVGELTIADDGTISSRLVTDIRGEDPKVAAIVKEEIFKADTVLSQKVGESTVDLVTDIGGVRRVRNGETNLADFAADAIREKFHADVGLVNGGTLRGSLAKGDITCKSLMTVYPFTTPIVVKQVMGKDILDALEVGAMNYPEENGGFLQVSGLTYTIDASIPSTVQLDERGNFAGIGGARRVSNVKVNGQPIDPMEDYTVAGNAYILKDGGNGMSMLAVSPLISEPDVSDMDTLVEYIEKHGGTVGEGYENPGGQGRITIR